MISIPINQQTLLGLFISSFAILLLTIGFGAWQWRVDWQLAHAPLVFKIREQTNENSNQLISAIPDEHLFGKSLSQGAVPVTNLQLVVTGIVKSGISDEFSKVYISIAGQPSKIYRIGDLLPYGVKIYKITTDTVIFDNDGRYEKLSLARTPLHFKDKPTGFSSDV